jgi:hypothetical protein
MTEALKAITLQEFQNCFEQWKKLWDKCIASQGEYFEGDLVVEMFREIYDFFKKNSCYFWVPPRMFRSYLLSAVYNEFCFKFFIYTVHIILGVVFFCIFISICICLAYYTFLLLWQSFQSVDCIMYVCTYVCVLGLPYSHHKKRGCF